MTFIIALALIATLTVVPALVMQTFRASPLELNFSEDRAAENRRELRSYLSGLGLACALTGVPFALVYWPTLPHFWIVVAIGAFAVVQIMVHFRFFLHIEPRRQKADDLHLMLFTTLILILMGGGTVWVLANLASRMH